MNLPPLTWTKATFHVPIRRVAEGVQAYHAGRWCSRGSRGSEAGA